MLTSVLEYIIKCWHDAVPRVKNWWSVEDHRTEFYTVATLLVAVLAIIIPIIINYRQRHSPPADTDQEGTEIYEVVDANTLAQYLGKPGKVIPAPVDRPEMATLPAPPIDFVLISAQPEIGAEDAACHLVERIGREWGLTGLKVLLPKGSLAVPDEPPKGCGRDVILLIDDMSRRSINQPKFAQVLRDTADCFADWFPDGYFCIVAIAHSRNAATLRPQLAKVFPNLQHVALHPLQGDCERQYMQALAAAFGLQATPKVIDAFVKANDGTVLNAYDIVAERKTAAANALSSNDADELRRRTQTQWRIVRLPKLPPQQQRVIALLSMCRSCDVPLHSWIVEDVARQQDKEMSRFGSFLWHLRKGRALRNAMDQLAATYIPRTKDGIFTPHDSRLDLDREDLIFDAQLIARTLVPLCDDRPVPVGLRDAYSALETVFYNAERHDLLLPLLLAWQRTSTSPDGDASSASALADAFDGRALLPASDTPEWAALIANVGHAYTDLPTGNQADNLHKAIDCQQAASQVLTEEQYPLQWALIQYNLGNTYRNLRTGKPKENIQLAIDFYRAAQRVQAEKKYHSDWARTTNNLGVAYRELPGDLSANLKRAIKCFQAVLRVYKKDLFPSDWAMTQTNIGVAYMHLPTGTPGENIQRAIRYYDVASRVHTEKQSPLKWALLQYNLGVAYWLLPTGDRGENLQQAIDYYNAALRVYTEDQFPSKWAKITTNIGGAYSELPEDHSANLKRAIKCFQAVLRVYKKDQFPSERATAQQNLGVVYAKLSNGTDAANLRQAITYYEAALTIFTEDAYPHDHAKVTELLTQTQQRLAEIQQAEAD